MGGGCGRPFFFAMPQAPRKYPAVTIVAGTNSCGAVDALEGVRMLATHAPTLPMSNCSVPAQCRCRFRKFPDRRDDEQGRRSGFGEERAAWYAGGQRRKSRGRREKD